VKRSVLECTPDFNFKDIDIIADRSVLRQLNFAIDGTDKFESDGLRIDFQRIGNSVVLFPCYEYAIKEYDDYRQDFENKITVDKQSIWNFIFNQQI